MGFFDDDMPADEWMAERRREFAAEYGVEEDAEDSDRDDDDGDD